MKTTFPTEIFRLVLQIALGCKNYYLSFIILYYARISRVLTKTDYIIYPLVYYYYYLSFIILFILYSSSIYNEESIHMPRTDMRIVIIF